MDFIKSFKIEEYIGFKRRFIEIVKARKLSVKDGLNAIRIMDNLSGLLEEFDNSNLYIKRLEQESNHE